MLEAFDSFGGQALIRQGENWFRASAEDGWSPRDLPDRMEALRSTLVAPYEARQEPYDTWDDLVGALNDEWQGALEVRDVPLAEVIWLFPDDPQKAEWLERQEARFRDRETMASADSPSRRDIPSVRAFPTQEVLDEAARDAEEVSNFVALLMERYGHEVAFYCTSYLDNHEASLLAVRQTFSTAEQALAQDREPLGFARIDLRVWLFRICCRLCRQLSSVVAHAFPVAASSHRGRHSLALEDAAENASSDSTGRPTVACLMEVSAQARELLLLHACSFKLPEILRITGRPKTDVLRHFMRGLSEQSLCIQREEPGHDR